MKCVWLFLWWLDWLEVFGVYYFKFGIYFESDKFGSVVIYEIFFVFII